MSHADRTAKKAAAELRARAIWMFEGTVTEMEWVEAPYLSAADARRIAVAELCPSLQSVVINAWAEELPASEHPTIVRQVKFGVRHGCSELLREVTEQREVATGSLLFAPASYWEPPVAETEPSGLYINCGHSDGLPRLLRTPCATRSRPCILGTRRTNRCRR